MNNVKITGGVWSAAPTPFTSDWKLDHDAVKRLVEHQLKLGVKGIFIGGTSGEGPWLTQAMLRELSQTVAAAVAGRIPVAVQITDNSAGRMLEHLDAVSDVGVDIAIIAPPFFQQCPTQDYLKKLCLEVIENSPLPIGLYHRGKYSSVSVTGETIAELASNPKVIMIKDSSGDLASKTVFLKKKRENPELLLLAGDEFDCIHYLVDGYDGVLFGGACFNAKMAVTIFELVKAGKTDAAKTMQQKMNDLMYTVFGGKDIPCWLAGQKQMLVELGIFSTSNTIINYQLTPECATAIQAACRDYRRELLPYLED